MASACDRKREDIYKAADRISTAQGKTILQLVCHSDEGSSKGAVLTNSKGEVSINLTKVSDVVIEKIHNVLHAEPSNG